MEAEAVVLVFVAAWNALDDTRIFGLMADDIVYHNMPMKPVLEREAVRGHWHPGRSIRATGRCCTSHRGAASC